MKTAVKKLYEAMFLVDSAQAAADWDGVVKVITTILEKAGSEIVSLRKWDERKLAYDIGRHSRGTYILCYFRAEGGTIHTIERDIRLSERVMRVLVLNAEHLTQADIEKPTPAMNMNAKPEPEKTEAPAESKEPAVPEESEIAAVEVEVPTEIDEDFEVADEADAEPADDDDSDETSAGQ